MNQLEMIEAPIRSNLITHVAPYFTQELIYHYCYSIDDKEGKGLCTNDLKRDLLRIISFSVGEVVTADQKNAITYISECITTYDEKLERLWKELHDFVLEEKEQEVIEKDFYFWKKGTSKYEIWGWFDHHHSKGVSYLIYLQ
ncbi:hypothetical protein ACFYKX_25615 [Cytobacillus sp. FJAT-54145]|uniref:Uncharacterized protein n=1 Tax=Cytobacillus spartinae TaxID=3299023 RepID=A0ABW6KL51_9BACI